MSAAESVGGGQVPACTLEGRSGANGKAVRCLPAPSLHHEVARWGCWAAFEEEGGYYSFTVGRDQRQLPANLRQRLGIQGFEAHPCKTVMAY